VGRIRAGQAILLGALHVSTAACFNRSKTMNIFYIIGVVVVVIVVAGFLGVHV
jgi:hypothetical protein